MNRLLTFGVIVALSPVIVAVSIYAVAMCDRSVIALWSEEE